MQSREESTRRPGSTWVRVSTVLGVGVVVSLVVGLVVGWVTGDVPRSLGTVFSWGMVVTAVLGVLAAVRGDRAYRFW